MPDPKFVLKEPNGKDATLIYLFFYFNNQVLKYSTGEKIKPKYWNIEKQRAKQTQLFSTYASLNNTLDNLFKTVKEAYSDLVNAKRPPTPYKLKDALDRSQYKDEYSQKTTFLKFVDEIDFKRLIKSLHIKVKLDMNILESELIKERVINYEEDLFHH